jgi:hypothetical protein
VRTHPYKPKGATRRFVREILAERGLDGFDPQIVVRLPDRAGSPAPSVAEKTEEDPRVLARRLLATAETLDPSLVRDRLATTRQPVSYRSSIVGRAPTGDGAHEHRYPRDFTFAEKHVDLAWQSRMRAKFAGTSLAPISRITRRAQQRRTVSNVLIFMAATAALLVGAVLSSVPHGTWQAALLGWSGAAIGVTTLIHSRQRYGSAKGALYHSPLPRYLNLGGGRSVVSEDLVPVPGHPDLFLTPKGRMYRIYAATWTWVAFQEWPEEHHLQAGTLQKLVLSA